MKQSPSGAYIEIISVDKEHLDAGNYSDFKENMKIKIQDAGDADGFILDLSLVMFVDSAGLGAVLSMFRHLNERGIEMKIAGVNGAVKVLFELVRLNRIMDTRQTVDDALCAFSV